MRNCWEERYYSQIISSNCNKIGHFADVLLDRLLYKRLSYGTAFCFNRNLSRHRCVYNAMPISEENFVGESDDNDNPKIKNGSYLFMDCRNPRWTGDRVCHRDGYDDGTDGRCALRPGLFNHARFR